MSIGALKTWVSHSGGKSPYYIIQLTTPRTPKIASSLLWRDKVFQRESSQAYSILTSMFTVFCWICITCQSIPFHCTFLAFSRPPRQNSNKKSSAKCTHTNVSHFYGQFLERKICNTLVNVLAVLAQMVACLPLVQKVRGSIPGGVVNFNLKIFNLRARRGGDVHFLIARLYITALD